MGTVQGASGALTGVAQVVAGGTTGYAVMTDKSVTAWGGNDQAQIGDGSTTTRVSAVAVSGLSNVTTVSGTGSSVFAKTSDGKVWGWGDNTAGQLGDGTTTNRATPTQLTPVSGQTVSTLITASVTTSATYFLVKTA